MFIDNAVPITSCPSWDTAAKAPPSQRASPSSLSSAPSHLQDSVRENAQGLFDHLSPIGDCIYYFLRKCVALLRCIFPCFFSSKKAPVKKASAQEEPSPFVYLEQKVMLIKHHVQNQLEIREVPPGSQELGISSDIVKGGKVAMILKYNNQMRLCVEHLHEASSLEKLKDKVHKSIQTLNLDPDNSRTQADVFSITTITMSNFQTVLRGKGSVMTANVQRQTSDIKFNLNFRVSRLDHNTDRSLSYNKDEFMKAIKQYTVPSGIDERTSFIAKGLEHFFYNT